MKVLLLTGSNGLLGQKMIDLLLKENQYKLIATSRGSNRYPHTQGYVYEELDISDESQVDEVFKKYLPEVVIHTAAITNVDTCDQQRDLCRGINVDATAYLANACKVRNSHLIYLSTDFIFDGKSGPYDEDALPNPISFYGKSKLDGEHAVINAGCKWSIIRTVLVYGVIKDKSRSNIVLWAKDALEKGDAINVVNDQWRTPTLAEDLAQCCFLVAHKSVSGIFNACGKDMLSIIEIVKEVATYWHLDHSFIRPISTSQLNQTALRPKKTGFIIEKAIRELGYHPHSFNEGLVIVDKQLQEIND